MSTLPNTFEPWMQNLLLLSGKGALLALAIGLVLLLLRRHVSPAWRHGLWFLVLLRFALPDMGTSPLSLHQVMELPAIQQAFVPVPDMDAGMQPEAPLVSEMPVAMLAQSPPAIASAVSVEKETSQMTPAVMVAEASVPAWRNVPWLLVIWLAGVLFMLGIMVTLHVRLLVRLRRDSMPPDDCVSHILLAACEMAGVHRAPLLIITDAVRAPALFGVLRPVILLPRELVLQGDDAALKLVLLHELAHLQRRDLWAQMAASLILSLHWFNPVAWWAVRRMRAEAEIAADARALACTDADEVHRFGMVLLGFASRAATGWMLWLVAATVIGISENKHDLRRRVEALKDIARGRRARWIIGLSAFLLLAVAGLTRAPAQLREPVPTSKVLDISGIVVDEAGKPVPGAKCALSIMQNFNFSSMNETSDTEGRFSFVRVPIASSLSLSASHKEYSGSGRTEFNGNSQMKEHRIVLPSFTWVTGHVTDKRDGKPIKDARVFYGREVSAGLGSYRWTFPSVRTSETGEYRLPIKTTDTKGLIIRAWAQDMTSVSALMDLEKKETTYDAALQPVERIPGKVVNAEGQPVKDAFVWVIEDRFVLDERKEPLTAEFLKSRDKRKNLADGKMFVSLGTSVEGGDFKLHAVDPLLKERLWVAAIHPEEGVAFLPAKDLKAGVLIKLHRWASFSGIVQQPDGSVLADKRFSLSAGSSSGSMSTTLPPALKHYVRVSTGMDGSYKVDRMLPNCWLLGLQIPENEYYAVDPFEISEGSMAARTIKLRPSVNQKAPADGRLVRGRFVMPKGYGVKSDVYMISAILRPDDGRISNGLIRPDAEGRFILDAIPPGTYTMSLMVIPRQRGMLGASGGPRTLRFKIDDDADHKPYDLADIVLAEEDFAFVPQSKTTYETPAEGGFQPGTDGHVEILAADHVQRPVPGVKIQVVDLVDQARQPLALGELARRIPEVTTDAQGGGALTFPRTPAPGVSAAGVLVQAVSEDGAVSGPSPVMDGTRTRVSVRNQISLDLQVSPPIASWTASNWMDLPSESPAIGGTRISGALQMTRSAGLLIRGRQADGTVLFSEVQKLPAEGDAVLRKTITLSPGVTLEGMVKPLTAGQKLDGWVMASVMVQAEPELGQLARGYPPTSVWHVWAPVRADGSFVMKDIPRGRVSVFGMGDGWQCLEYKPDAVVPSAGSTQMTLKMEALSDMQRKVKILLPDGTPAAHATVSKSLVMGYAMVSSLMSGTAKHVVAPEDATAYESFKKTGVPGLRSRTNAQGEVTLTHLLTGRVYFHVYWLDVRTGQPRRSSFDLDLATFDTAPQTITLKEVLP